MTRQERGEIVRDAPEVEIIYTTDGSEIVARQHITPATFAAAANRLNAKNGHGEFLFLKLTHTALGREIEHRWAAEFPPGDYVAQDAPGALPVTVGVGLTPVLRMVALAERTDITVDEITDHVRYCAERAAEYYGDDSLRQQAEDALVAGLVNVMEFLLDIHYEETVGAFLQELRSGAHL